MSAISRLALLLADLHYLRVKAEKPGCWLLTLPRIRKHAQANAGERRYSPNYAVRIAVPFGVSHPKPKMSSLGASQQGMFLLSCLSLMVTGYCCYSLRR